MQTSELGLLGKTQGNHCPGILYVLPEYDCQTDTHFYHLYQLLELLANDYSIHLLVERGVKPVNSKFSATYLLPSAGRFLALRRAFSTIQFALKARMLGCGLIYSHYSYYGGILAAAIFRFTGGRALYWNCGLLAQFRHPWRLSLLLKKAYQEFRPRLTFATVNALVTGTPTMARYYSENYNIPLSRIEVVPNWVDLARFNPSFLTQAEARRQLQIFHRHPVFLYVHSVSIRKGADRLVPIMERLLESHPDALLLIVGGGADEAYVQRQVEASQLQRHILLIGRIPNPQLLPFLAAADVFLMPSREEGFPHVLLEAMAVGLPFVATDVGGVRDFTTGLQQQFVVTDFTPEKFSERVALILENRSLALALRDDGLKVVEDYSLENVAQEFACVWDKWLE